MEAKSFHPLFFSPTTGIYTSINAPIVLPQLPTLDLVTHLFSFTSTSPSRTPNGGAIALLDSSDGSSISYAELLRMVSSVASGIQSVGIRQNDVILMLLPNTILFPVIFLAVLKVGAVASPLNPTSTYREINDHISECPGVAVAFVDCENESKLESSGIMRLIVKVPQVLNFEHSQFPLFSRFMSSDPTLNLKRALIQQTDAAVLLCSSGTSGPSKRAVVTHGNLISAVELFVRFEASQYVVGGKSQNSVYLCVLPMFHIYGLSLFATGLFALGSTVVVMRRRFDAQLAGQAIERYKITHLPVVPPMLPRLVRAKKDGRFDFSSLIQLSSGAAPLSDKVISETVANFPSVDFIQGYGMTETTAVGTRGFNNERFKKYTSVGLLAPNMEAKIVDVSNGLTLGPDSHGELWLRGSSIMKGYLNNEEMTSKVINSDGWLRTGDIAHFDQDGYLYIIDRLKEMIKYNGYQIAPADLEAVLITHPEIADVGVTAFPNDEVGEMPMAFIMKRNGSRISAAEVMDYTANHVAPHKKVRKVEFVDSIPRSPSGKILRRLLSKRITSKI